MNPSLTQSPDAIPLVQRKTNAEGKLRRSGILFALLD
jgi:hypothetical protein